MTAGVFAGCGSKTVTTAKKDLKVTIYAGLM